MKHEKNKLKSDLQTIFDECKKFHTTPYKSILNIEEHNKKANMTYTLFEEYIQKSKDSAEILDIIGDPEFFFFPESSIRLAFNKLFSLGIKTPELLRKYANFIGYWDTTHSASDPSDEVKALRDEAIELEYQNPVA